MKKIHCPSCGELCQWEGNPFRPFCKEACREKDLGNWATERYRFESKEETPSELDYLKNKPTKEDKDE
jgi:endogenous inhibitor of DNA gyrase (YacG/DUF329 family)